MMSMCSKHRKHRHHRKLIIAKRRVASVLDIITESTARSTDRPDRASGDRRDLLVETKLACEGCLGRNGGDRRHNRYQADARCVGGRNECISPAATLLREKPFKEAIASGHAWMAHSLDWREDGSSGRPSTPYIFMRSDCKIGRKPVRGSNGLRPLRLKRHVNDPNGLRNLTPSRHDDGAPTMQAPTSGESQSTGLVVPARD